MSRAARELAEALSPRTYRRSVIGYDVETEKLEAQAVAIDEAVKQLVDAIERIPVYRMVDGVQRCNVCGVPSHAEKCPVAELENALKPWRQES